MFLKARTQWGFDHCALVQVTDYMAEKTYHFAQYLGHFGAYLKPHNIIDYWIGPSTLLGT